MDELPRRDPQNLAGEQILEILAAVRIVGEQQDLRGRGEHEQHPDQRFLRLGALALGPGEEQRAHQRGGGCGDLRDPAARAEAGDVRGDHAEARHLCDREVDEHDPAREHLLPERHVRQHDENAGNEGRPQDAQIRLQGTH